MTTDEEISWYLLRRPFISRMALKGDGRRMPAEYAETSMTRLYFKNEDGELFVEHYKDSKAAYQLWLALPKGVRCAMRNANETLPVYSHDLVDRM